MSLKRADELLAIRREGEPKFARVWYELLDDARLTKKHEITLYCALARIADFSAWDVIEPDGRTTGRKGYACSIPAMCYRSKIMRRARIGSPKTFYAALASLIAAGWIRRDRVTDIAAPTFDGGASYYRNNLPPCYTLLHPRPARQGGPASIPK